MKKILALFLAAMMLLSLSACGGGNKKDIVGTWHIVDETTQTEYGLGIQFEKDGTLRYGLTEEMFGEDVSEEDLAALDFLMKMEYKIKSDTEMEVTMKALMGLKKEKVTVTYSLDGDTLVFDGVTYTRVK
ncbi:MAG: hypothetical protein IKL18_04135 [Oscillospiraceae bacterium]|nr:hypothetical protein [Oscillospiraceae bacterium]